MCKCRSNNAMQVEGSNFLLLEEQMVALMLPHCSRQAFFIHCHDKRVEPQSSTVRTASIQWNYTSAKTSTQAPLVVLRYSSTTGTGRTLEPFYFTYWHRCCHFFTMEYRQTKPQLQSQIIGAGNAFLIWLHWQVLNSKTCTT